MGTENGKGETAEDKEIFQVIVSSLIFVPMSIFFPTGFLYMSMVLFNRLSTSTFLHVALRIFPVGNSFVVCQVAFFAVRISYFATDHPPN